MSQLRTAVHVMVAVAALMSFACAPKPVRPAGPVKPLRPAPVRPVDPKVKATPDDPKGKKTPAGPKVKKAHAPATVLLTPSGHSPRNENVAVSIDGYVHPR
jgi:hypothetical protein